jgi:hypothetical protein
MKKVENQEQKKKLLKQIGKYTTAAGAALLTGNLANANVHFTTATINLDGANDNSEVYYPVDFDGDGLGEISIGVSTSYWSSSSYSAKVWLTYGYDTGVSTYEHVENDGNYFGNADPAPLALNKIIGPTLQSGATWDDEGSDTIVSTDSGSISDGSFGYYPGETRYLGVRFTGDSGANWYYGWVGIQINHTPLGGGTVGQIINYAYEDIPNTPIYAGGGAAAVPVLPIVSAIGLGLSGLFGFIRNRRKKNSI